MRARREAWSSSSALFASWASWASKAGEALGSQRKFSQKLAERPKDKFHKRNTMTGKGFDGLRILPVFDGEAGWETR